MPAIDTEFVLPHLSVFYHRPSSVHWAALNSMPKVSAQDEAAVTSRDKLPVVVVMLFPGVDAVMLSAIVEQLFAIGFGKSLMKIKNKRCPSAVP